MPETDKADRRFEQRRRQIMARAAVILRKREYFGFSIDDLCRSLKINKTTFYRYFSSKEELLFELHQTAMTEFEAMLNKVLSSDMSAKEKLVAAITGQILMQQRPGVTALTIPQLYIFSPRHKKLVLKRRDEYEAKIRVLIQQGIAEGAFRNCDPKMQAILLMSALHSIQNWYREGDKYSVEEIAHLFVESLLHGLLARPVASVALEEREEQQDEPEAVGASSAPS